MDRNRPLIGICAYEVPAAFSHWRDVSSVMIPSGYTRSVHDAGGVPLVLPPFEDNTELLDLLDGLVFSGGPDIGPEAYGADPHAETTPVWPHRDRAEIALMRAAIDRRVQKHPCIRIPAPKHFMLSLAGWANGPRRE